MQIKAQLDAILNKQLDRKDFIKHVLMGLVAVMGLSSALRLINHDHKASQSPSGHDAGAYGGPKDGR